MTPERGVRELTGGKVASSAVSLSKRESVVLMVLQTTSSQLEKTGSNLAQ